MTPLERAELAAADGELTRIRLEAKVVAESRKPPLVKYFKLIALADRMGEKLAPHVPCRRGCDQCCHIGVAVMEHEVQSISFVTGRQAKRIRRTPEATHEALVRSQVEAYGVPCPFLVDHACSIYDHRPMACRAHHSLDDTAERCDTRGHSIEDAPTVPTLSLSQDFQRAACEPFLNETAVAGDIREFFE